MRTCKGRVTHLGLWSWRLNGRGFFLLSFSGSLALLKLLHDARRVGESEDTGERSTCRILGVQNFFPWAQICGCRCESHRRSCITVGLFAVAMTHETTSVLGLVSRCLVLRGIVPFENFRRRWKFSWIFYCQGFIHLGIRINSPKCRFTYLRNGVDRCERKAKIC